MAGKGSRPRNCFSEKFKKNFEDINWTSSQNIEPKNYKFKKGKKIYKYP